MKPNKQTNQQQLTHSNQNKTNLNSTNNHKTNEAQTNNQITQTVQYPQISNNITNKKSSTNQHQNRNPHHH